MRVGTDDASRRLRFLWLGPQGWRFPFEARFVAWALAAGLGAAMSVVFVIIMPTVGFKAVGVLVAFLIALTATKAVMPHVDHDRPVKYHRRTLANERRAPRPITEGHDVRVRVDIDVFDRTETVKARKS
ncbi:MAG: hypothetical protein ACRCYU_08160 [Nocardioides sp.]